MTDQKVAPETGAWTTRADLLADQRDQAPAADRRALSLTRRLRHGGWFLLLLFGVFLGDTMSMEYDNAAVGLVVSLAVVGVATWRLALSYHRGRKLIARAAWWAEVDRDPRWRDLPAGNIDPALLTVHDARDDLDHIERVALRHHGEALGSIWGTRFLTAGAFAGFLFAVAVIPIIGVFVFPEDSGSRVVWAVAALVSAACIWESWGSLWRMSLARQRVLNRAAHERAAYWVRATVLHGHLAEDKAPQDVATVSLAAKVASGGVPLVLLAVLGYRLATASWLAIVIAVGILALIAAAIGVVWARQRRLHVVSLLAPGPGMLQRNTRIRQVVAEPGRVVLRGTGDEVVLDDVRAVARVPLAYAAAPDAYVVVTTGAPVVVAGRGVDQLLAANPAR